VRRWVSACRGGAAGLTSAPTESGSSADFRREYETFADESRRRDDRFRVEWDDRYPCLNDKTPVTEYDRHYVLHPAWAARVIREINPREHVDISSTLTFCGMISAFVPTRFYDFRPAELGLSNLTAGQADLTRLHFPDGGIASLSCMHVVEHIGLGRYGDPLDPLGDVNAMKELQRVLAPGGSLLFVVPVGRPRVCFNAHRIYAYEQIIAQFRDLSLRQFALIPDGRLEQPLILDADPGLVARQEYACGCFWFTKPPCEQ